MSEVNLYPGNGMGGEVKLEEEKWKKEARDTWSKLSPHILIGFGFDLYLKGYLQACRKRQEDEITLELAFKDRKFSGIVVGDHLIESGEVVEYIKKGQEEIERLKVKINHLAERI